MMATSAAPQMTQWVTAQIPLFGHGVVKSFMKVSHVFTICLLVKH